MMTPGFGALLLVDAVIVAAIGAGMNLAIRNPNRAAYVLGLAMVTAVTLAAAGVYILVVA